MLLETISDQKNFPCRWLVSPFQRKSRVVSHRGHRRGAAAVELALVLPLFLLLLAGVIEFGNFFRIQHLLSTASRRGARSAVLTSATTNQVSKNVRTFLADSLGVNANDIKVEVAVDGSSKKDLSEAEQGSEVSVKVSLPYSKAASSAFSNWFSNADVSSSCALEHE